MKTKSGIFAALITALISVNTLSAGLVNGSFETPTAPAGWFFTFTAGSAPAPFGWQVAAGEIDLLGNGYWQHSHGQQSVDLNGLAPGAIYQDFTFDAAGAYVIKFDLSANPDLDFQGDDLGTGIKNARVDFGTPGLTSALGTYGVDAESRHITSMNYVTITTPAITVSDATIYRLQFTSLVSGKGGAVIDNVRIEAVPEPGAFSILALAAAGILVIRRNK